MNAKMRRGGRRHYRELGRKGAGVPKTFEDRERAKEQRRLAGIASGKARARKAKRVKAIQALMKTEPNINRKAIAADMREIASRIKRLNESATRLV